MSPSSERGTKDSERRIQGVHAGIYNDMEKSRMSPSSDRGAKGSERGTQGVQSIMYKYGCGQSHSTGNRDSPTNRYSLKPYNNYGDVARINTYNSSTNEYSNRSRDNNNFNSRTVIENPIHPTGPYTSHHGCHPGGRVVPNRYRHR